MIDVTGVTLVQLLFTILNIVIADYHAHLFREHKKISHAAWAIGYTSALGIASFAVCGLSWQLAYTMAAVLVLRIPVFNTAINYFRERPLFYLGTASLIDRIIAKHYPIVFFACIIAFIILQFFVYG